jgi:nitrite reductase/ring-hydroxylating ferredoxin subunit
MSQLQQGSGYGFALDIIIQLFRRSPGGYRIVQNRDFHLGINKFSVSEPGIFSPGSIFSLISLEI